MHPLYLLGIMNSVRSGNLTAVSVCKYLDLFTLIFYIFKAVYEILYNSDLIIYRSSRNIVRFSRHNLLNRHIYYRPETKFAKVMFLHLSVSYSVQRGWEYLGRYPREVHSPGRYPLAGTPPRQVHPPTGTSLGRYPLPGTPPR